MKARVVSTWIISVLLASVGAQAQEVIHRAVDGSESVTTKRDRDGYTIKYESAEGSVVSSVDKHGHMRLGNGLRIERYQLENGDVGLVYTYRGKREFARAVASGGELIVLRGQEAVAALLTDFLRTKEGKLLRKASRFLTDGPILAPAQEYSYSNCINAILGAFAASVAFIAACGGDWSGTGWLCAGAAAAYLQALHTLSNNCYFAGVDPPPEYYYYWP